MDQKTNRRNKSPFGGIPAMKGRNSSSRHGGEHSMNTTADLKESPEHSPVASPSVSSSSFFETTSLKFRNFSASTSTHIESFRVFAATWNVAGKTPNFELNLNDFLPSDDHSDIYVLGFQEVVSLNAGNVLVIEDNELASRWLALINQALNCTSTSPPASRSFSQSASPVSALHMGSYSLLDPSLFHKNGSSHREVCRATITRGRRLKSCTCPAERAPRRRSYSKLSSSCLMLRCGSKQAPVCCRGRHDHIRRGGHGRRRRRRWGGIVHGHAVAAAEGSEPAEEVLPGGVQVDDWSLCNGVGMAGAGGAYRPRPAQLRLRCSNERRTQRFEFNTDT